jgi:hypothetical protein
MTVVAPERIVSSGGAPKRRSKIVAMLVVLVVGLGAWAVVERLAGDPVPEGWTRVDSLQHVRGAGVVFDQDLNVFLVYDAPVDRAVALSGVSPHSTAGPEQILFCRSSEYFEATQHGEKFDRFGRYAVGPAPRGMDRFAVMVLDGDVYIDEARVIPGPPRFEPKPLERTGGFCGAALENEPGFADPFGFPTSSHG